MKVIFPLLSTILRTDTEGGGDGRHWVRGVAGTWLPGWRGSSNDFTQHLPGRSYSAPERRVTKAGPGALGLWFPNLAAL